MTGRNRAQRATDDLGRILDRSRRSRTGPKPRAGTTSTETLRFRCSEAEAAEILDACRARRRDMSDVARDLLLAWARGGER